MRQHTVVLCNTFIPEQQQGISPCHPPNGILAFGFMNAAYYCELHTGNERPSILHQPKLFQKMVEEKKVNEMTMHRMTH